MSENQHKRTNVQQLECDSLKKPKVANEKEEEGEPLRYTHTPHTFLMCVFFIFAHKNIFIKKLLQFRSSAGARCC
jgi:hypothetical protein